MDYQRFDYGSEINKWRCSTEDLPQNLQDPVIRIKEYNRIVSTLARLMSESDIFLKFYAVKQEKKSTMQIFEYMLKLLPTQDFFEFIYHEPSPPDGILLEAAEVYDPQCFAKAKEMLKQYSEPDPNFETIMNMPL